MQQMSDEVNILKKAINSPQVDQGNITKWIGRINQDNLSLDEVADGKAVIHYAVEHGHVEVVRQLIAAGANVNGVGAKSPLLTAVEAGQPEIVKVLLEEGAHPDGGENDPQSPLFRAVEAGKPGIVERLLGAGANPNGIRNDPQSPLFRAVDAGQTKIVDMLLGAGANPNGIRNDPHSPLYRAAETGDLGILKSLLAAGAEVNDRKLSLLVSTQNGSPPQTTKYALVLSSGTDDDQNPTKCWKLKVRNAIFEIDIAQIEGCQRLVELLDTVNLQNIEERNQNLLFKLKVEKLLCKWFRASFPNLSHENYENNARPLHIACQLGLADVVRMLIGHGADVATPDEQGNTPLRRAVANAQPVLNDKITTVILPLLLKHDAGFGDPDLAANLKDKNLFGHIPNLGPVMVIGTRLTRKDLGFQDAITNETEFEEFLEHEKMKESDLLKFAKKYRALCEDRALQLQGNDLAAMRDFHKMLDRHVRERLKDIYSKRMKSAAQQFNGDSESGVLKGYVQTLIDVVWNPHNDSSKRTELDETFYQLMQQLMALQTYLQEDEGLKNSVTWPYRRAKAEHYAPAVWPILFIILGVIIALALPLAIALACLPLDIVLPANFGVNDYDLFFLSGGMTMLGSIIAGLGIFWLVIKRDALSSTDIATHDTFKNQLPLNALSEMQQDALQGIFTLLEIFEDDNLITSSDIQALRDAKTLGDLGKAINAILETQKLLLKPGFTYSENVRNSFTLYSQQRKPAHIALELGAEPDSSAGESYDEGDPLLSAGHQGSKYGDDRILLSNSSSDAEESDSNSLGLING